LPFPACLLQLAIPRCLYFLLPPRQHIHGRYVADGASCSGGTISIAEGTYDDLSLTSTATGSTNLLSSLNPGFESGSQTNIWSLSGGARPSTVEAHAGASSLLIPAEGSATQTVTGCVPSSSYTVYAWYYGAGATASLQAGGGTAATGSVNQWTLLSASIPVEDFRP
jgi:hypothetical protein